MFTIREGYVELRKKKKVYFKVVGTPDESKKMVVCVHGIGGSSCVWDFLSKDLATTGKYSVLSFDLFGRGSSENTNKDHTADLFTEQIHELVNHSEIKFPKFTLVGHSMGGGIAVHFANKYPDLVENLILMCPAGAPFPFPTGSGLIKIPCIGATLFKAAQNDKQVQAQNFYDVEKCKDLIDWLIKDSKKTNSDVFSKAFVNSFKHFPLAGLTKEIEAVGAHPRPSLIIWGEEDETVPFKLCFPVYEKAFNTHAVVYKQTKHCPYLERKEEANQLVLDFLDGKITEKSTQYV